jgi:hypothetical protein
MRPNFPAYIEMQLPPLEQTVVTDSTERSAQIENRDNDADDS